MCGKFALGFVLLASLSVAHAEIMVGTCLQTKHTYPTISAGIAAATPGDVVLVCPGTYPEYVEIDKPITLQGIVLPNQPGVTITGPASGLNEVAGPFYAQVVVKNAGGPVTLRYLSVTGPSFVNLPLGGTTSTADLYYCDDPNPAFYGLYVLNTPGIVSYINVTNELSRTFAPDENQEADTTPNCGNGIGVDNSDSSARMEVTQNAVSNYGQYGIVIKGNVVADHNVISATSGPQGAGIQATGGIISNNVITGLGLAGDAGINGGDQVYNNTVQSSLYGIENATSILHNTLLNNSISLSKFGLAADNLIVTGATYRYPYCAPGEGSEGCTATTAGIDLACSSLAVARDNSIVGSGIGIANVPAGEVYPSNNLFANVTTLSTSCSQ